MDGPAFVDLFIRAARQAGAVALHLRGRVANEGKDVGDSAESAALTAVDLAAQDLILLRLAEADAEFTVTRGTSAPECRTASRAGSVAPVPLGLAVDAEEDTPLARAFPADGPEIVVLDPIDGTLNYARGHDDFAVMASLLRDGRHEAAVIHFPVRAETWWALRGGGCFVRRGDGAPERVWRPTPAPVLMLSPMAMAAWDDVGGLGLARELCRCSAVFSSVPATGRAAAAIAGPHPDRRTAIGFLLATEAGGVVRIGGVPWTGEDPRARPLPGPTVRASTPALADRIEAAITAGAGSP